MYELNLEDKIIKYLPLVERVARRISVKSTEYEYDDLYNIGVIGLMDALQKFDETKKVPFEGYATIRIKGAIIDEVRKHSRISRTRMAMVNEYYRAKQELENHLKRDASDLEISKKMGITLKQLAEIYDCMQFLANVSLEGTLFGKTQYDEGSPLSETIEDTQNLNGEQLLMIDVQKTLLEQAIQKLSKREQLILSLYYKEEVTLKEIAAILDISIARVSQLHGRSIAKLKQLISEERQ